MLATLASIPRYCLFLVVFLLCYAPSRLSYARPAFRASETVVERDSVSDAGLDSAHWIWTNPSATGTIAVLRSYATPTGRTASSATIYLTVVNSYTLWVNGNQTAHVDRGADGWKSVQSFSAPLAASWNTFSILAVNDNDAGSPPPGLLAAIKLEYTDGSPEFLVSNNAWSVSTSVPNGWPLPQDTSSFVFASELALYTAGEWGSSLTVLPAGSVPPSSSGSTPNSAPAPVPATQPSPQLTTTTTTQPVATTLHTATSTADISTSRSGDAISTTSAHPTSTTTMISSPTSSVSSVSSAHSASTQGADGVSTTSAWISPIFPSHTASLLTSASSASNVSPSSTSALPSPVPVHSRPSAAVLGGIVGGVMGCAIAVLLMLRYCKRKPNHGSESNSKRSGTVPRTQTTLSRRRGPLERQVSPFVVDLSHPPAMPASKRSEAALAEAAASGDSTNVAPPSYSA